MYVVIFKNISANALKTTYCKKKRYNLVVTPPGYILMYRVQTTYFMIWIFLDPLMHKTYTRS